MSSRYGCLEIKSHDPIVFKNPAWINLLPPVSVWAIRSIIASLASSTKMGLTSSRTAVSSVPMKLEVTY